MTAFALVLVLLSGSSAPAQGEHTGEEVAVPVLRKEDSRRCRDFSEEAAVIDEASFRDIVSNEQCSFLKKLDVDFSAHTLIVVRVTGDCFVRASVEVTRNDNARKYTCRVKKIYGGCRAAGSFQRWVVVEKLRPDYNVEFVVTRGEADEDEPPTYR